MYKRMVFPALSRAEAEAVHERTLNLLRLAGRRKTALDVIRRFFSYQDPRLQVEAMGLKFANPLGIAAGFDKNGVAAPTLAALGFGHVEVGTVTPKPQPGNPRPRIFRLVEDKALINRMGFPGEGAHVAEGNLMRVKDRDFVLGVNVGANKASVEHGAAVDDYVWATNLIYPYGDYITINVSSPNTAKLRDLQGKEALAFLIDQVLDARNHESIRKPVLVKIAPDLSLAEVDDVLDVVLSREVDGIIATNTTLERPDTLRSPFRTEQGGLSGRPLEMKATAIIRYIYKRTEGRLTIIGVGGVFDHQSVLHKMRGGASLVQAYTGFVYEGPTMSRTVNRGLVRFVNKEGLKSLQEIVGEAV